MAVHFCFGRPMDHLVTLVGCAADQSPTSWTIDRHAVADDLAVFYLTQPLSAVVAWGIVAGVPALESEGEWADHHMVAVGGIHLLPRPVSRESLVTRVPEWGFLRAPRRELRVPDEHAGGLLAALGIVAGVGGLPVAQVVTSNQSLQLTRPQSGPGS